MVSGLRADRRLPGTTNYRTVGVSDRRAEGPLSTVESHISVGGELNSSTSRTRQLGTGRCRTQRSRLQDKR